MSQMLDDIIDLAIAPRDGMIHSCTDYLRSSRTLTSLVGVALAFGLREHNQTKKDIEITKDIDSKEWKLSLSYTKNQVDELVTKLLQDYGMKPTPEIKEWLHNSINGLISAYQKQYDVTMPKEIQSMLFNLVVRMAYDRLTVNE